MKFPPTNTSRCATIGESFAAGAESCALAALPEAATVAAKTASIQPIPFLMCDPFVW